MFLEKKFLTAIKGISIGQEETKLLQYADMTAVLSDSDSAQVLFELLDHFKTTSGLMVNCSKTEGMCIEAL